MFKKIDKKLFKINFIFDTYILYIYTIIYRNKNIKYKIENIET